MTPSVYPQSRHHGIIAARRPLRMNEAASNDVIY
jgi:hypothetical protein